MGVSGTTESAIQSELTTSAPGGGTATISEEIMSAPASSIMESMKHSSSDASRSQIPARHVQPGFRQPAVPRVGQQASIDDSLELRQQEILRLQQEVEARKKEVGGV